MSKEYVYPFEVDYGANYREVSFGLTIRDHFAGIALGALIKGGLDNEKLAEKAYLIADEMMKERKLR